MSYVKGTPTIYKGIRMRSRLEATFAAFLDKQGSSWRYEPNCFADERGQYYPDFLVDNGDGDLDFIEIKPPTADTGAALSLMHIIRSSEPRANLYVAVPTGNYPNQGWVFAAKCESRTHCAHCAGTKFTDLRSVPGANRNVVPTDPSTGRATIGGRARREDGTRSNEPRREIVDPSTGRARIGGRARRGL